MPKYSNTQIRNTQIHLRHGQSRACWVVVVHTSATVCHSVPHPQQCQTRFAARRRRRNRYFPLIVRTFAFVLFSECSALSSCFLWPIKERRVQWSLRKESGLMWPLSVTDVVVKRLVRHCHVPCCSHKYKYKYKYTHTHNTIMSNIVQEGLKRLAIAACLPALTNAKTITNTRTHTYTMTTDMVVKTKEAWKTLLRAALTKHCVRHCFKYRSLYSKSKTTRLSMKLQETYFGETLQPKQKIGRRCERN